MIFQDCVDKICNIGDLLENLLKGDSSSSFEGIPSLRKIVEDNKNKTGANWDNTKLYKEGDIISYNDKFFLCIKENSDKNPETETLYWEEIKYSKIIGSRGFEKYITVNSNGETIEGGGIEIEQSSYGEYYLTFDDVGNTDYTIHIDPFFSDNKVFYAVSLTDKQSNSATFRVYNKETSEIAAFEQCSIVIKEK